MVRSMAVLADVHGVLPALDAVLAEPAVAAAEVIVVAGDHTWGPQPAAVLDRLAALGSRIVLLRGNADRELLQMCRGVDVGLGDDPLSVWCAAQLTAAHQRLLDAMPDSTVVDVDGFGPVFVSHATPRDDEEVVLVDSRIERWLEVHADLPPEIETVVCGHTHMPFVRVAAGRLVVNPGSVGLPYGRRGAHWALLADGVAAIVRTVLDPDDLITRIAAASGFPGVRAWLEEVVREPASDVDALREFGPRDGR